MPQSWDAKYFDGKSPQSMLVRIQLLTKGVMLHFMDGRSQHWKHESFSIVRDRENGPIRLLRGDFPQETVEIPDQGFASILEQKGLSGKGLRTSWKQKSISVFAAIVLFSGILYWILDPEQPGITRWMVQWIPVSLEEQMGEMALTQLFPNRQTCSTPKGDRALETLMLSLIPRYDPYRYKIEIIRSPQVNALAFPGGRLVLFSGLLESLPSAESLAGILAHEIQHIRLQHGTQNLMRQLAFSGMVKLIASDSGAFLEQMLEGAKTLANLNYSRSFETEADLGAAELLKQQGFSQDFLVQAFRSFENNEAVLDSAVPQYFSTHPDLTERIEILENQNRSLESSGTGKILNPQSWKELKYICANVNSP